MKTEDFERLRKLCDDNGFELVTESPNDNDKFFVVKKKDEWEGVEFVQLIEDSGQFKSGKIFKVLDTHKSTFCRRDTYFKVLDLDKEGIWIIKHLFKPSTEQAYVEQLKKEAFERFGIIKDADKFIIEGCSPTSALPFEKDWIYFKEVDILQHYGATIYQQGKWAERVKERIEVTYSGSSCKPHPMRKDMDIHEVRFYVNHTNGLPTGNAFDFIASQLEKYLNGEIK